MRFPDWYLTQLRERISIADYAGKRVSFDRRKSKPSAGDYWAPCPFHNEKTASFHVRDGEGTYKCFGCGEAGNAFTLCQKLEGVSFVEAVERFAEMASFPPPAESPAAKAADDRRASLYKPLAAADAFFRAALAGPSGAFARSYLQGRGFAPQDWERFGLGYAPDGWTTLIEALEKQGYDRRTLIECGLAREGGRSGAIDTFRNRVTFAIGDAQGRPVAFGARALSTEEQAKYINSPETELFKKGHTLYRLKEARALLAKTKAHGFVVAEGYFDVIAFERAGIAAVAPLGTALTTEQLALAWKAGPSPILCFDGDNAGLRAADRALDVALPELGPTHTIRVALLPPGQDPDDLYRKAGPEALAPLLDLAKPAVDALFEREKARSDLSTPEARSDLKKRLEDAAGRIKDPETRRQYLYALRDKTYGALRAQPKPRFERGKPFKTPDPVATDELKALARVRRRADIEAMVRAALDYPFLLRRGGDLFAAFPIADGDLNAARHAALDLWRDGKRVDREAVGAHLTASGRESAAMLLSNWPKQSRAMGQGRSADAALSTGGTLHSEPSAKRAVTVDVPFSAEMADELEAEWMAFLALDVTDPQVKEDLAAARLTDLDADDDAFAAAEAALRARRTLTDAAFRRGREDVSTDQDPLA